MTTALMIVLGRFSGDQTGLWRLVDGLFFETEESAKKRAHATGFSTVKIVNLCTHAETAWDAQWGKEGATCVWVERVEMAYSGRPEKDRSDSELRP